MQYCNVVIFSYHYLLDPKIAERVSRDFSKDCIVVFDEAHNIDNVCIEALSTDITEDSLRRATRGAKNLEQKINEMRDTDQEQLQNEYQKLVQGLRETEEARQEDAFMANPGSHLFIGMQCDLLRANIYQPCQRIFSKRQFQEILEERNILLHFSRGSLNILRQVPNRK